MNKEATRDERDAFFTLKSTQGDKDAPESHGGEQDKGHLRMGGRGRELAKAPDLCTAWGA